MTIRSAFNAAAHQYDKVSILQQTIAKRLFDHLDLLKTKKQIILDLGAGTGEMTKYLYNYKKSTVITVDIAEKTLKINYQKHPKTHTICADANHLPIKNNSINLIISNLMLQWCADIGSVFTEVNRVLVEGGLFLFSTFGPQTLNELKTSWQVVDNHRHTNQLTDMHDIGDKLSSIFQSPVIEAETILLTYNQVTDLMKDLKQLGANTVLGANGGLTGKTKFQAMQNQYENYRKDDKLPATYEVIYAHAWNPKPRLEAITVDNIG